MKRLIFLLLCVLASFLCYSQQGYTVRAKINNPSNYTFFLAYSANNKFIVDTNYTLEQGYILFKGKVDEPVVASFGMRRNPALTIQNGRVIIPGPSLQFVLTNEEINIEGDANTIYMSKVKGGKENKEWASIKTKQDELTRESWTVLKNAYDNFKPGADSAVFRNANKVRAGATAKDMELRKNFIHKNPHSLVSMYFLSGMVNTLSFEDLKKEYEKLGDDCKDNSLAKRIAGKITSMEATAIGKSAVPINKKDINGNIVNLQTLKGKYVLVDFWGSWCGPCRASHPHLKEVYAKYKNRGFEILGIATEERSTLEENQKVWKQAIEQDGINWIQVLNNEDADKFDAVKAYGVTAFPTKILLDKDGKIIERYVGEEREKVDAKLKVLFGN